MASEYGSDFTIVTGGAVGADNLAELHAKTRGMHVKLCLTPHHHRAGPDTPPIPHWKLNAAEEMVEMARVRLGRSKTTNPFVNDLLARNWYMVEKADMVVAYGKFLDDTCTKVEGGTGVTVQMCADHNRTYPDFWKSLYVYDESRAKWYELEGEDMRDPDFDNDVIYTDQLGTMTFRETLSIPLLSSVTAVVGSRQVGPKAKEMMERQFTETMKSHVRWKENQADIAQRVKALRLKFAQMRITQEKTESMETHTSESSSTEEEEEETMEEEEVEEGEEVVTPQ